MPTGKLAPDEKLDVKLVTPTASVAVGAVHVAMAVLLPGGVKTVILAGTFAICGAVVSCTVMVNVHVVVLLLGSLDEYVIGIVPTINGVNGAGPAVRVVVTGPELSVAVGSTHGTGVVSPIASVTMLAGHWSVGGVTSLTVITNECVAVLVAASLAVYVTVVWPIGKAAPDACVAEQLVTPTLSVATGFGDDQSTTAVASVGGAFTALFGGGSVNPS